MDDIELAKKWSKRMLEHDDQYRDWARYFVGQSDDRQPAELWEIAPGAVVGGPVGYMKVNNVAELVRPWAWRIIHFPSSS